MRCLLTLVFSCLFAALVRAQTQTVTNALGQTVVEVISTNLVQGVITTQIIQTIEADEDETTTSTSTSTTSTQQNPIQGQPVTATGTGLTTFEYTTTDAAGNTEVLEGTFTPTFDTVIVTPSLTFSATVLDYSQWLSIVGTNTVAAANIASSAERLHIPLALWNMCIALVVGAAGGAWFVVA